MKIIGHKETVSTTAMKHELYLEPLAKRKYTKLMKRNHKQLKSKVKALAYQYLKKDHCIAASADLEVSCVCCGGGLSEIKCPY